MDERPIILSACRTAIGTFGGSLRDTSAVDLGAAVVREAMARAGVDPSAVDEVILGCVLQAGAGMNVARQAALKAGVPEEVPAETVNRVCGSGLQAVIHAARTIQCGEHSTVVAGGTESMSSAPYLLGRARWGTRLGHSEATDSILREGLTCAIGGHHMGITAEAVAERFDISRDDQDAFALESQRRAQQAIANGAFRDEVVPVDLPHKRGEAVRFEIDEHPRATTADALAKLKPAFKSQGTVTAGNSSGINDGASALVIASPEVAAGTSVRPLGRLVSHAVTGVSPEVMGMGPVSAVRKALCRAKLKASDIGRFELNEAFAAQSVAVVRELGIDSARVNVNGGAIALGHPIGASGARVLTTLLYALRTSGERYGVAALCIGGGMGIAVVVEAL